MKHSEAHPDLTAFVLDGLEPGETEEAWLHLASCSRCRDELEGLRELTRALAAAPPPADPPAHIKGEILSLVRSEKSSHQVYAEPEKPFSPERRDAPAAPRLNRLICPSVATAVVVAVVALGMFFALSKDTAPVATVRLVPTPEEASGLDGYWGVAEIRPQPSDNQEVELRLNNFDEPEPDRYYQVWFVSGERRISAGSFTSAGSGETRVRLNAPPEVMTFDTLLITEERIGTSTASGTDVSLEGEMP